MSYIDVVFDGPPSHESGRFVECEAPDGSRVSAGEWAQRPDGLWRMRIEIMPPGPTLPWNVRAVRFALGFALGALAEFVAMKATS